MPSKHIKIWEPVYSINPPIARALMEIESAKTIIANTVLSPAVESELRHKARIKSTHYSTRIEGNRLTLKETEQVIKREKTDFHGRERDVKEVRNYWDALLQVENWAVKKTEITENLIKKLHAIIDKGRRAKPTPYRDGQNVIRDSASGTIVYMPPEAKDVPHLMYEMVRWALSAEKTGVPAPIIASLLHYQFVTIHPYYDGNGRTARLLATFILQRAGYGLNGFFSLEEHHAKDIETYYNSLAVHQHHNYYEGRKNTDISSWVEYFVKLLATVFTQVKDEALRHKKKGISAEPKELSRLDRRAKIAFSLFAGKDRITVQDVSAMLGLSGRMVRLLMQKWVKDGWLIILDSSNRSRSYGLSAKYRKFI